MPATSTEVEQTTKQNILQHIVKLDDQGQPSDECLCGYVWDQMFLKPNGNICEECLEIAREHIRSGS